jgi:hypothetical protein
MAQNILALRDRTDQVMTAFLQTELEFGHALCKLAKRNRDQQELFGQYLRGAHTALEAVTTFIWRSNLEPSELGQWMAQIERLKFELASDKPEIPLR